MDQQIYPILFQNMTAMLKKKSPDAQRIFCSHSNKPVAKKFCGKNKKRLLKSQISSSLVTTWG